jgi:hypothetical protein
MDDLNDFRDHLTPDQQADLDWLAEQFVLGELPPLEEEAVASRLSDDDALAAAVARASRLVAAVRAAALVRPSAAVEPALRPRQGRLPGRWLLVAAGATAAAVAWLVWPTPPPRLPGPAALPGSTEVVEFWQETPELAWAHDQVDQLEDSLVDDEAAAEPDTVPGWMLAAVSLDGADGEFEVLEN